MLPMYGRVVALSAAVLKQFQAQESFEQGTAETVGMLLGRIDSEEQVSVHYAPPLLHRIPEYPLAGPFASERIMATVEAAWHLRGWTSLGYWIAHDQPEMDPRKLVRHLNSYLTSDVSSQELIFLTLLQTPNNTVEIRPYTYVSRTPLNGWRDLQLTALAEIPLPESQEEGKKGHCSAGEVNTAADIPSASEVTSQHSVRKG